MSDHIKVGDLIKRLQTFDKSKPVCFGSCQNGLHFNALFDRGTVVQIMFDEVICRDRDGNLIAYDP